MNYLIEEYEYLADRLSAAGSQESRAIAPAYAADGRGIDNF